MATTSTGRLLAERYRVIGRLGAGGMAVVVLAEDERLGRKVAVKRLHAESPDEAARRFDREAKVGASLNHPNIVAVYDTVADDDGVLIVMEYVDGHTLRQEMDAGPIDPARAIELLWGVAAGLDHAHSNGVVHRDVKPANVLIAQRDGAVKLTDLGIATAAERTNITGSGVVMGTAAYMAPERLDGHAGGPPADVYALAAVAFEMLSGRRAFTGRTAVEVARRVVSQPPPDLAEAVPTAPPAAAAVLKRGLAKDPAERQASAGELVRALAGAYADAALDRPPTGPTAALGPAAGAAASLPRAERPAPVPPRPPARPPADPAARRRPPALLLAAGLLVAAAVLAAVLIGGSSGGGTKRAGRTTHGSAAAAAPHHHVAKPPPASTPPPPATPPPATPPPATGPSSPTAAVTALYTRAASQDLNGAWALGTDNLHRQFKSFGAFAATFRTLRSITFPSMSVTGQTRDSATVAFSSVAQHTDHVDRCSAQATVVRQGGAWLVDRLDSVVCNGGGAPAGPKRPPGKAKGHFKPPKPPKH